MVRGRPVRTPPAARVLVDPAGRGDCTTIQEALDALPATGGRIQLADGTHSIAAAITISGKTNIIIEGGPAAIVDCDAIGVNHGITLTNCTNIHIRGFQFARTLANAAKGFIALTGTNSGHKFENLYFNATAVCSGIYGTGLAATTDILVQGCTFVHTGFCGGVYLVVTTTGGKRIRIVDNSFYDANAGGWGVYINGAAAGTVLMADVAIADNTFENHATAIRGYGEGYNRNISITGNTILGGGEGIAFFNYGAFTDQYISVVGNTLRDLTDVAINIRGSYIDVTGNVIKDSTKGIAGLYQYCNVVGNLLYSCSNTSIEVAGTGANITGNLIISGSGNGIYLTAAGYSIVSHNTIHSTVGSIYLNTSHACVVEGNALYAPSGDGIQVSASNHVVVSDNMVYDATSDGIFIESSDYAIVIGNKCTECNAYGINEDSASDNCLYAGNELYNNASGPFSRTAGKILYQNGLGSIKKTGSTTDAYVTIFDVSSVHAGLAGAFRIKNVDGSDTLTYQVTFTGMDASSQAVSADITAGNNVLFDAHTDQGAALAPFKEIKVELKSKAAGTPADYGVYMALAGAEI